MVKAPPSEMRASRIINGAKTPALFTGETSPPTGIPVTNAIASRSVLFVNYIVNYRSAEKPNIEPGLSWNIAHDCFSPLAICWTPSFGTEVRLATSSTDIPWDRNLATKTGIGHLFQRCGRQDRRYEKQAVPMVVLSEGGQV